MGVLAGVMVAMLAGPALAAPLRLERIELVGNPATVVRLHVSAPATPRAQALAAENGAPDRIFIDLADTVVGPTVPKRIESTGPILVRVRVGQFDAGTARVVLDLTEGAQFRVAATEQAVTIELAGATRVARLPALPRGDAHADQRPPSGPHAAAPTPTPPADPPVAKTVVAPPPAAPAPAPVVSAPPAGRSRREHRAGLPAPPAIAARPNPRRPPSSSARACGRAASARRPRCRPRRPGPGRRGRGWRRREGRRPDLTLPSRRLTARLPVDVLMTRTDDSFVPIERRLASESATLFISLHANACSDPSARGLEVFYGGGTLRQATSAGNSDWRAALLGRCLDEALQARIGGVRGQARPAGFVVLARNPAPSALVEIGYLTHPDEAARARDRHHQEVLADALVDGVAAFLRASAPPL
jgi:N-acetylmuramoyl-L-alanine amidase